MVDIFSISHVCLTGLNHFLTGCVTLCTLLDLFRLRVILGLSLLAGRGMIRA